jgi:hypothetical protein
MEKYVNSVDGLLFVLVTALMVVASARLVALPL